MDTENLEVDHLQENIALLKDLDIRSNRIGMKAFHKAGHVLMYHHFQMRHGSVSLDEDDSIEDDLSYESLKHTNYPERFMLIALGGVVMEELLTKSKANAATSNDEDIDKAILLILIHNRMNKRMTVEDDIRSFVMATSEVSTLLLRYQHQAGLFFHQILEKGGTLKYDEILSFFKNNKS